MSKAIILFQRPNGLPKLSDFQIIEQETPRVSLGQVLLKPLSFSVDPYMRTMMSESASDQEGFDINQVIEGFAVAQVVSSQSSLFAEGDYVYGTLPWKEEVVISDTKIEPIEVTPEIYPSIYLGLLGVTGLSAYLGYKYIAKARVAETIVISSAAGAVGHIVGQLAKLDDCRVIGLTSTPDKHLFLKDTLGFDSVIDYRDLEQLSINLKQAAPIGVDVYFDHVGGAPSDVVLAHLNHHARVVVCGQMASYDDQHPFVGPYPQLKLLQKSASMTGFMLNDYLEEIADAREYLKGLYLDKKIIATQTTEYGFDSLPKAFVDLFQGRNIGKLVVEL